MGTLLPHLGEITPVKRLRIILAGAKRLRADTIRAFLEIAWFRATHLSAAADKAGTSARRSSFFVIEPFSPGEVDAANPPKNALCRQSFRIDRSMR
jgi:hypothetical protein